MIKKILGIGLIALLVSCGGNQEKDKNDKQDKKESKKTDKKNKNKTNYRYDFYGDTISSKGTISPKQLVSKVKKQDSVKATVNTKIIETCNKKGCWMSVDMGDSQPPMVVRFNYDFFVPKSGVDGRNTIFEGIAFRDTLSVSAQKELAIDANQDTSGITDPKPVVAFTAEGVRIDK